MKEQVHQHVSTILALKFEIIDLIGTDKRKILPVIIIKELSLNLNKKR